MACNAAGSTVTFSCFAMWVRCSTIFATEMRRKSKRWQRDKMVGNTFSGSVVAKINFTCAGGSSSVFNSALNAAVESMCTSSMM